MLRLLLVCAGGAVGSGARFLASTWAARTFGADLPRGTLAVNVAGSFLLAVIVAVVPGERPDLRLFLGAGVMGGFTTYSSFNHETISLFQQGRAATALAYLCLTVLACLASGVAGLAAGRLLAG